ncbi:bifunctional nicotinamide-nucleotide adenylyltransferase/Nudix hydroxylase [uncultured Xylophilus sp.]|uniref:bifunctional nicotinamide-nucleotide adenylyltransferase/Nudix hydroxylase n=1 Tax=uncultured Xylophilus sp. TaxID=296832 RepID=UPI0025EFC69C|nr:bifunctional nicotinamide-nucleotide adenylyltransferase/Nudix hydroxylase [uncultured Xylophilus sp.]
MTTNATTPAPDIAVCIGRFQILHNGHLAMLRRALSLAPRCVVVLGSAFQARTPRNPFTWEERAATIRLALPEADRDRIDFVPTRDYYDQAAWTRAVRQGVEALAGDPRARIVLVGHRKDATSAYLEDFPGWTLDDPGLLGDVHGTGLRDAYFAAAGHALEPALATLVAQVPPATLGFLRSWAELPAYADVAAEWRTLREEKARWAGAPYAPVFVTVDAVIRCAGKVLLIRRGRAPGRGLLAVPGGFLEPRETVYQSALRELAEETGLRLLPEDTAAALRAVHVFDHPDRSQRGRVITHAHYFDLGDRRLPEVAPDDDAAATVWMPVGDIAAHEAEFHDDHFHMLDFFFGLTGEKSEGFRHSAQ